MASDGAAHQQQQQQQQLQQLGRKRSSDDCLATDDADDRFDQARRLDGASVGSGAPVIKGSWSPEEDEAMRAAVGEYGLDWKKVALRVAGRTSKQCRDRYKLKLDPTINHSPFSAEEDAKLTRLHTELGRQWTKIAQLMPGRTENSVKSRFASLDRTRKREWTDEEDLILRECRQRNVCFAEIAANHLNKRSEHAIKRRWERLFMRDLARRIKNEMPLSSGDGSSGVNGVGGGAADDASPDAPFANPNPAHAGNGGSPAAAEFGMPISGAQDGGYGTAGAAAMAMQQHRQQQEQQQQHEQQQQAAFTVDYTGAQQPQQSSQQLPQSAFGLSAMPQQPKQEQHTAFAMPLLPQQLPPQYQHHRQAVFGASRLQRQQVSFELLGISDSDDGRTKASAGSSSPVQLAPFSPPTTPGHAHRSSTGIGGSSTAQLASSAQQQQQSSQSLMDVLLDANGPLSRLRKHLSCGSASSNTSGGGGGSLWGSNSFAGFGATNLGGGFAGGSSSSSHGSQSGGSHSGSTGAASAPGVLQHAASAPAHPFSFLQHDAASGVRRVSHRSGRLQRQSTSVTILQEILAEPLSTSS